MKPSLKLSLRAAGRSLRWPFKVDPPVMRALLIACVLLLSSAPVGAEYTIYWTVFPYDGSQAPKYPSDNSRIVFGKSPTDACSKRTADEIIATHRPTREDLHPIVYVGMLTSPTCGFKWVGIDDSTIINEPTIHPNPILCSQTTNWPADWARPPKCPLDCPDPDKLNGDCLPSTPKNGGESCPECGNPVNPATGNKFQKETDYAAIRDGQLNFVRYYNSGLPAVNMAVGGFWSHTFNSSVVIDGSASQVSYTRADGREYSFNLQSGSWVGDADVSDVLTELKNANGRRTGWRYRIAANEDTEVYDASGYLTAVERRNGLTLTLVYSDGTDGTSSGNGGFVLDASGNPTATVLPKGLLLRAVDQFGKPLTFGYDTYSRIVKMTDPAGGAYLYSYGPMSGVSNLLSVTYPDGHQRAYAYNEPANTSGTNKPNALTGITDENGFRFASYKYNDVSRAIESVHHTGTGDVYRYQLTYTVSAAQTSVTDPLGTARNYGFQNVLGVIKNNAVDLPEPGVPGANVTYDAQGNISSRTDWNGNRTNYAYDLARNLETSRTEGLTAGGGTTAQTRTITTEWHASFRLPTRIAEPLRITTYVYNGDGGANCGVKSDNVTLVPGALCSKTIQATTDASGSQGFSATPIGTPRSWSYTYNANGSVLTVNGPRIDVSDVTTYTYYANDDADLGKRGNVATITNAAGHITSITAYNAHGQPLTTVDPNGLTTTLAYDARQRLISRNSGGEVTSYDHDAAGQLIKVTMPDGSYLSYTYDGAHRLTDITDNLGNRITYTLDAMGNRTQEQMFDPASQLAQTRRRVYNSLNRLFQELGAQNQTTEYSYDDQGNVTSVKDPLNHTTANQYDALNRLRQVTDPSSGVTQYAYDGLDTLTQVTDPRDLVTGYTVDGLGNLTQQASPDTGTTTNTYDAAGNLLTQTDAKGQVTTYSYDALNRITLITFHDGSKQSYAYDQGTNGMGRLSSITETNPANQVTSVIAYAYDQHGRVTSETRTVGGVQYVLGYHYDGSGRLDQLTYPSGRTVSYTLDSLGRVSAMTTAKPGGQAQSVVSTVAYHPFGGVKAYTLGNGQQYTRSIDLDGRIASYTLGAQSFAIGYDAASRISFISEIGNPPNSNTYGYDALDRLTNAATPSTGYGYGYDAVGNRLSRAAGAATDTYAYGSTSNRIASITPSSGPVRSFSFDANGSTTADGNNTYAFDTRGRMVQAVSSVGTTSYQVNALGQRIRKTNSLGDTVFHYDTRGHLIAETDPGGGLKRELIYLGDIPVGVVQ